ncbi:MAG: hypothetical protein K2O35_05420 [Clostridia bacterium]|nr:hypothetical protein [Clostridia bacterium]
MKFFKRFFMAMLLIGVLSTSAILGACNPNDRPTEQPSGVPSETEQPSGAPSGNDEIIEPYTLSLTQFYLENRNPYISDYFNDESKLNIAEKINSVEELKSFCEEKHLKVFDETDTSLKYDKVSKKLKECDEEFFSKRSIVLIFRFKETTDFYTYDSIDIKDGVMTVNLVTANGNTTTDVTTQVRIFEISKQVAKEINEIKVEESIGELDQKIGIKIYDDSSLDIESNYSAIINTTEEINTFCDVETSPIFSDDKLTGQNNKIIETLKKYDEEFFQNKSIVVLFRFRASSGYFFRVKDFEINENSLNITLSRKLPSEPAFYPCDVITCVYILEMDKDMIANVNQINVNEIEE